MAMLQAAFRDAITRCEFNVASRNHVIGQGFNTADAFIALPAGKKPTKEFIDMDNFDRELKPPGRAGISSVATGGGRGGFGGCGGDRGGGAAKARCHSGHYELAEWQSLTEDEKNKVYKLREEKKNKRKTAAAETTTDSKKTKVGAVSTKAAAVVTFERETDEEVQAAFLEFRTARAAEFAAAAATQTKLAAEVKEAAPAATLIHTQTFLAAAQAKADADVKAFIAKTKAAARNQGRAPVAAAAAPRHAIFSKDAIASAKAEAEPGKGSAGNQFGRFAHSAASAAPAAAGAKEAEA